VRRVTQRPQQTSGNQDGDFLRREAEKPGGLFAGQATRRALEIQKSFNIVLHATLQPHIAMDYLILAVPVSSLIE
jgi:hypothetical protein